MFYMRCDPACAWSEKQVKKVMHEPYGFTRRAARLVQKLWKTGLRCLETSVHNVNVSKWNIKTGAFGIQRNSN